MVSNSSIGSKAPFLRPHPHSDGRNKKEVEPGCHAKKGSEIRFAALEEFRHHEGEKAGEQKEDNDKDERYRRRKIAAQLALGDRPNRMKTSQRSRLLLPLCFGVGQGDAAENFIETALLHMQLLDLPTFAQCQFTEGTRKIFAGAVLSRKRSNG
jgi:hypothetical protein